MPRVAAASAAAERTDGQLELTLQDGKFSQLAVHEEDIGAELLPILSKGLYTDPLHCMREYVQNSVDAEASQVKIKITGNSVIIHDNGVGMTLAELVQARQFGVSRKNAREHVGFRGIGIYSGFDLCNRLLVTTKRRGERRAYVLEFNFGQMKQQLESDAEAGNRRTPLTLLLTTHSRFSQEPASAESHGTTVQLEDLSDFHIAQLRDREKLKAYILRNLPIDFSEKFEHRKEIVARLREEVSGYKAVQVVLESDTDPREVVTRPAIPDLDKPTMGAIKNKAGDTIAYYWACLRKAGKDAKRGKIPDEFSSYRGFVYKVKGFTIGDNTKLQRHFKTGSSTLYSWYTGEIYVTDPAVIPNTERDDFETNAAYETLQSHVIQTLKTLERTAAKYQEQERAYDRFKKREERLEELARGVHRGAYDRVDAYAELDRVVEELSDQRPNLAPDKKDWGKKVIEAAQNLRSEVRTAITRPSRERSRRKAAQARAEAGGENRGASTTAQNGGTKPDKGRRRARRSIAQAVDDAGVALGADALRVLAVIDEAIAAVLLDGSDAHVAVLDEIEAALAHEFAS